MDERQEMEVIGLLEEMISELGHAYSVSYTSGTPKTLHAYKYIIGKEVKDEDKVLSEEQLKLLASNENAKDVIKDIVEIIAKSNQYYKEFKSRLYIWEDIGKGFYTDGNKLDKQFIEKSYNSINDLNIEHVKNMINHDKSSFYTYMSIINNHLHNVKEKYLNFVDKMVSDYQDKYENNETLKWIIKNDEQFRKSGAKHNQKNELHYQWIEKNTKGINKKYKDFISSMDNHTDSIQKKEQDPHKQLKYKLQYLLARNKIINKMNRCTVELDEPEKHKVPKWRIRRSWDWTDKKQKSRNNNVIKETSTELSKIMSEYKDEVKNIQNEYKEQAKEERRAMKEKRKLEKAQKKQKLLPAGTEHEQITSESTHNSFVKRLKDSAENITNKDQLIKKFITKELKIPNQYTRNPVVYDALSEYIENYTNDCNYTGINKNMFDEYKKGLIIKQEENGITLKYRDARKKLINAIDISMKDEKLTIINEKECLNEMRKFIDENRALLDKYGKILPQNNPNTYFLVTTKVYDLESNIEFDRIKEVFDSEKKDKISDLRYIRNPKAMELVDCMKNGKPVKTMMLSIDQYSDIATLDATESKSYRMCLGNYQTELYIKNREEGKEYKMKLTKEAIAKSKYKDGFFKYQQYADLKQEINNMTRGRS